MMAFLVASVFNMAGEEAEHLVVMKYISQLRTIKSMWDSTASTNQQTSLSCGNKYLSLVI